MIQSLIYLYCITNKAPALKAAEDLADNVQFFYYQGLYAVVSNVSTDDFSEESLKKNLANMVWVEKKTRQHEAIIEEIMKNSTVLPFKFATLFESEKNIEKLLKEHHLEFKQILERLEGKEEWGLKIYCNLGKFKETLKQKDERIQDIEKQIASTSEGKAYLLKKKKEELVKNIINEKFSEYTQDSFIRLKRISLESKINRILPKEVTEREDEMVANFAFLIEKDTIMNLLNTVDDLKIEYSPKGLIFDCTGPWPSYNFCFSRETKNE